MRNRINSGLVATTSKSETKRRYAKKNNSFGRIVYSLAMFGKVKQITQEQYETLVAAGLPAKKIIMNR